MRVALLTREYPPFIYGGAGVHVEHLVESLRDLVEVDVHAMGEEREGATAHSEDDPRLAGANSALRVLSADLTMAAALEGADLVHSHTWYANLGGHLAKLLHGIPHVMTVHSLEPLRPWKAEQLGGGYRISSWAEQTAVEAADAVIAVSFGMRNDVIGAYRALDPDRVHVIHNGIDTEFWAPTEETDVLERIGVDLDRPYVAFVGRVTRQKGVPHLLRAALHMDPEVQLVLLAGAADTPDLASETQAAVDALLAQRSGVFWQVEHFPRPAVGQVLSHATAFACPSIYEPLGIVNLEAMACETAVVASAVGGIPEVVADGLTGELVPYTPENPDGFERAFAAALTKVVSDPDRAAAMGRAGRQRAMAEFAWPAIAARTVELYRSLGSG